MPFSSSFNWKTASLCWERQNYQVCTILVLTPIIDWFLHLLRTWDLVQGKQAYKKDLTNSWVTKTHFILFIAILLKLKLNQPMMKNLELPFDFFYNDTIGSPEVVCSRCIYVYMHVYTKDWTMMVVLLCFPQYPILWSGVQSGISTW